MLLALEDIMATGGLYMSLANSQSAVSMKALLLLVFMGSSDCDICCFAGERPARGCFVSSLLLATLF